MIKKFRELGSTENRSGRGRKKLISARVSAQLSRLGCSNGEQQKMGCSEDGEQEKEGIQS